MSCRALLEPKFSLWTLPSPLSTRVSSRWDPCSLLGKQLMGISLPVSCSLASSCEWRWLEAGAGERSYGARDRAQGRGELLNLPNASTPHYRHLSPLNSHLLFTFGEGASHVHGLGSSLCAPTDSDGVMDVCHCSITNWEPAVIEPALCKTKVLSWMRLF